jgi:choline dehydrogenase-like flavoprotein
VSSLPPSSFVARLPFGRRAGTDIFRALSPALVVASIYFPGAYSANVVSAQRIGDDIDIMIRGGVSEALDPLSRNVRRRLAQICRRLGAYVLPGTVLATPGADGHLGGLFPMGARERHGTSAFGELNAWPGLHLADGSVLPTIPSRPKTLTIMANADRIGRHLASSR